MLVVLAPSASAQLTGDHAVNKAKASRPDREPSVIEAHASFGRIAEDFYLTMVFRLNYNQDYWGLGLQLPLRIELQDEDPQSDNAAGILRAEDWDHWTDALRFFRYAYVGRADRLGAAYARLGLLERLTLGHGSILHRYNNGMDINRWRVGVDTIARTDAFGGEVVVGDVLSPYLTGVRGWLRPFRLRLFRDYWDRLEIGTTMVADWKAPFLLDRRDDAALNFVNIGDDNLPEVLEDRAFAIMGIDLGMCVFQSDLLSITPYTDVNMMTTVDEGWGVHVGVLWESEIPAGEEAVQIALRTEYRRVSGDYLGPYFNTVYEIERYQRLRATGGRGETKLASLCQDGDCDDNRRPWRNGAFIELQAGLKDVLLVGSEYIDYGGELDDGSFRLYVDLPYFEFAQLRAFYYRVNLEGTNDLFAFDERTALVAELHVPIYYVGFRVRWWRIWQATPGEEDPYKSVDDWNIGVIVRIKL